MSYNPTTVFLKTALTGSINKLFTPYDKWARISSEERHKSWQSDGKNSLLNYFVVKALLGFCGFLKELGVVKITDGTYVSQLDISTNQSIITYTSQQGNLQSCIYNRGSGKATKLPEINITNDTDLTGIYINYLLIVADMYESRIAATGLNAITHNNLNKLVTEFKTTNVLNEDLVRIFCDDLRINIEKGILHSTIRANTIDLLSTKRFLDSKEFSSGTLICGRPDLLIDMRKVQNSNAFFTIGDGKALAAEYIKTLHWSKEEENLIPVYSDDTPVAPEVKTIMTRFLKTKDSDTPFVNPCWRGITGYGKSTGVKMLACMLHTPYTYIGCASSTEKEEFFSKLIPNMGNTNEDMQLVAKEDENATRIFAEEAEQNGMPTLQEMYFNPPLAYKKITGRDDATVTADKVLNAYCKKVSKTRNPSTLFVVVESNFIRSLANGYICEVQEFSRIRDNGVLVALNGVNEAGANLPLVDGSVMKRKKNALVVWTDNIGYSSCRPVDASVLRRMSYIIDSDKMDRSRVIERVKRNTGCNDTNLINKLYQVWEAIAKYAKNNEIDSEGVVSIVELENWLKLIMIEGLDNISELCHEAIVSKLSSDMDTQKEIMDACVALELSRVQLA